MFNKVDGKQKQGEAECSICIPRTVIKIAYKGKTALNEHMKTEKHKKSVERLNKTKDLQTFWVLQPEEQKVIAAEATLAFHNTCHNNSFRSVDCTHKLLPKLFPDSKIAAKISCGRTKTEAIMKGVLAEYSLQVHLKQLEDIDYLSVGTDGSNHGSTKLFPVVVRYFDVKKGIVHFLLDFKSLPNETSDTITEYVYETTLRYKLDGKTIAFSGDNTNTNFGGRERKGLNNIFRKLKCKFVCNVVFK